MQALRHEFRVWDVNSLNRLEWGSGIGQRHAKLWWGLQSRPTQRGALHHGLPLQVSCVGPKWWDFIPTPRLVSAYRLPLVGPNLEEVAFCLSEIFWEMIWWSDFCNLPSFCSCGILGSIPTASAHCIKSLNNLVISFSSQRAQGTPPASLIVKM